MDILMEALHFAVDAYGTMKRKGDGAPMVMHAMEAASVASSLTRDLAVIAAAALHDVVEDAGVGKDTLQVRFGDRVAALVAAETEDKRADRPPAETWKERKQETIDVLHATKDEAVRIMVLADKLSNMRSFYRGVTKEGADFWQHFNQKDPAQHEWYYRSIAEETASLRYTDAWKEYCWLIEQVFANAGEDQN